MIGRRHFLRRAAQVIELPNTAAQAVVHRADIQGDSGKAFPQGPDAAHDTSGGGSIIRIATGAEAGLATHPIVHEHPPCARRRRPIILLDGDR